MSVTARSLLAVIALSSLSVSTARAEGAPAKPHAAALSGGSLCAQAYEQAQEQRQSGKLLEARVQLETCAQDACPEFIRSDCLNWDSEVRTEIPTVVFAARSAGTDLSDVQVSAGQRVLTTHINGEAVELDPGEYDFEFSATGMKPLTQHVLLARGERNRLLRAELSPLVKDISVGEAPPSLTGARRSWALPVVFGGFGVAGLAGFGVFGAWGHAAESNLKDTCSPRCSKSQISSVRTKYAVADISLAVGVASLGLATYFALREGPEQRDQLSSPIDVRANAQGLSAIYQGAF